MNPIAKMLLIMRLTPVLLLAATLHVSAKGSSQNISLSGKNISLERVFSVIEQQTHFSFVYRYNDIQAAQPVDLHLRNATVQQALDACLKGQHLTYTIESNIIAIKKEPGDVMAEPAGAPLPPTITGIVTNEQGNPLAGVTVQIAGSQKGTVTDGKGAFTIQADNGEVLEFSIVGYETRRVTVGAARELNITLTVAQKSLNDIVVTALGVRRSEKSLAYVTQQVSGSELTNVKTDNMMNALNGKVAGVTITPSASGVGGSTKVILRGNRSLAGNNQPLYVIDGVPITNNSINPITTATNGTPISPATYNQGQPNGTFGGTDGGDGISNLNPDDIESMSILEGAAAAALYGSQAANGVIIINTKKGREGHTRIDVSSSASIATLAYKPKFQNNYGQTSPGSDDSWGAKISNGGHDNLKDFFQAGTNFTNGLSLSGGSQTAQTYFSYANTSANGVEPTNKLERNNFNFREVAHFLDNKLTVDASANYITQTIHNTPGLGLYFNPLTGLYLFPRGNNISPYKNQYELPDSTGYARQNWFVSEDVQQNPWWILYRNPNISTRNRVLVNASAKYDFTSWLSLQARGNIDRTSDTYEQDLYSGTNQVLSKANGQFTSSEQTLEQKYGDLLLTFKIPGGSPFKLDGVLGTSILDSKTEGQSVGAGLGLINPNIFIVQNIEVSAPGTFTSPTASNVQSLPELHSQTQSIFGNVNLSYADWIYLTLSARNDWSSNLAYTNDDHYFYPSAGLSLVLSQLWHLPAAINYFKVRGSFAQVGNTVPAYVTNIVNYLNSSGSPIINSNSAFHELKPEKTNAYEAGTDLRFLDNRLNFSFTWYKSNTKNQFIPIAPSVATGFGGGYINAGNIQNTGVEFTLGYDVIKNKTFTWNTAVNASANKNKIIDLDSKDGIDNFVLTGSGNNSYQSILTKGGSFGDIYSYTIPRDAQGRLLLNEDGTPTKSSGGEFGGYNYVGNPNPKFQLGWNNNFTYKNFSLSFLVDGKFGGQVMSMTQAVMDYYGVSQASGQARDAGGVKVNGVDPTGKAITTVDAKDWYTTIGNRNGITGEYMYSATVVRLRELNLGYTFPFSKGAVKSVRLALTGRNLLYFYKKAPFDPELTMSTGNGLSGVDVFNQPATRNFGLNLNVTL
jgi:TonB-linked SusC/RagA family outer membrane protein